MDKSTNIIETDFPLSFVEFSGKVTCFDYQLTSEKFLELFNEFVKDKGLQGGLSQLKAEILNPSMNNNENK